MQNTVCQKLRVLCLPGHYNTGQVMKYQLAYYEHIFRDFVEFHYLTAPNECLEVYDPKVKEMFKGPFFTWARYDPKTKKRSGFFESYEAINKQLDDYGPYDGVIGFSQGGYMARVLLKSEEFGLPPPKNKLKFGVLISSPLGDFNPFPGLEAKYPVPMMYIFGKKDKIASNYEETIAREGKYTIIAHEQGHNIPKFTGEEINEFIQFFSSAYRKKFGEDIDLGFEVNEEFKQSFLDDQKLMATSKPLISKL